MNAYRTAAADFVARDTERVRRRDERRHQAQPAPALATQPACPHCGARDAELVAWSPRRNAVRCRVCRTPWLEPSGPALAAVPEPEEVHPPPGIPAATGRGV